MKKILALLLLFGIVGCEKEPSQMEKCVTVNSNTVYEKILFEERMNMSKDFEENPVVINNDLLNQFWEDWKPYGEEMGQTKEDMERYVNDGTINFSYFNKELGLISALQYFHEPDGFSRRDLYFSEIPTLDELMVNLKTYALELEPYALELELNKEFTNPYNLSFVIPLIDYMTKLALFNSEYYSKSNGDLENLIESNTRKKTYLKATEICNSQGIY